MGIYLICIGNTQVCIYDNTQVFNGGNINGNN